MTADHPQLEQVAEVIRGVTFKPGDVVRPTSPDSVGVFRTSNVQSTLELADVWGIARSLVRRENQLLLAGDVLMSTANSWNMVGRCCTVADDLPFPAVAGGFVTTIRPSHLLEPRYFHRWLALSSTQALLRSFARQTTSIANLDLHRLRKMRVPVPPLEEQRRIADVLDRADALRAKRRETLARLDELTQSIFADMFGSIAHEDEPYRLNDLVPDHRPITYGILKPGPDTPGGVPYVRVLDLVDRKIRVDSVRRTTTEIDGQYRRSRLAPGDLLISIRGHVGRMALVPPALSGANITQDSARIAVDPSMARFVMAALEGRVAQRWMARRVKGVAVRGLNIGDLRQVPIHKTSAAQVEQFTQRVARADHLRHQAQSHLALLDDLFASLQQRAFRGDLFSSPLPDELAELADAAA